MTQLELEVSRGVYKIAFIFKSITTLFRKIGLALVKGRQDKANHMIAEMMRHEYPHESYDYILHMVREGRVNEICK